MRIHGTILKFLIVAALACLPAFGQQDQGTITGTVTDSTGAVIPGASVTARETSTNVTLVSSTNEGGVYVVGPLKIGAYEISVETDGFKKSVRSGVEIHGGDRLGINFQLEVGDLVEVVTVEGTTPVLKTENATLDYTVERRQLDEFPLNGRSYQSLGLLSAGVAPEIGGRDRGPLGTTSFGNGLSINGQPALQNNYLIDGVDNNSTVMGLQDRKSQAVIPSLDAVQEMKIQTSNYSAEYGRNAGGVIMVSIRGGTNDFHGSAYEFLRNDVFDARPTFGRNDRDGDGKADPAVLRQNQWGGTLGGPIVKNKAFFFGSVETWNVRRAQSDLVVVPTGLERAGDFSQTRGLSTLLDPNSSSVHAERTAFPNQTIPANYALRDPAGVALAQIYPEPNLSDPATRNNFTSGEPWMTDRVAYDFRYDQTFSTKDSLFVRYSTYTFDQNRGAPLPGLARGGVGNDRARDDNGGSHIVISQTHVFTPNVINEFRFGRKFLGVNKDIDSDVPLQEAAAQFGLKGLSTADNLNGLPRFVMAGNLSFIGLGGSGFQPNIKDTWTYQWMNNLTVIRGNHSLKFGADIRYDRTNIVGSQNSRGIHNFNGKFTGISMADFLLGWINNATTSTQVLSDQLFRSYMFFVQDDWKVTPTLTLNLGLRYELTSPWYDEDNKMNKLSFDSATFGQTIQAGQGGSSWSDRGLVNTDFNNWAPRLGFAWQPAPKWTFRGGAGVFYGGQQSLGASGRMLANFPFVAQVQRTSGRGAPAFLLRDGFPADFLGDLSDADNRPRDINLQHWSTEFPMPTTYQWNFSLQRQLGQNLGWTIAYVGSSSNFLLSAYNENAATRGDSGTERSRRKHFMDVGNLVYRTPYGSANYNGLNTTLNKRFSSGVMWTVAYTWSHGIGNTPEQFVGGETGVQDPNCFSCQRGSNSTDVRQRLSTGYLLDLPFGRGRRFMDRGGALNAILGGWQFNGMMQVQTGQYYNVTLPNAFSNLGTRVGTWRPSVVGEHRISNAGPDGWYDPAAFVIPRDANGLADFGDVGRNSMQEPGIFNWDVGLQKTFDPTERLEVRFRWDVFNVTNHPSYGTPNRNVRSPAAGTIRSTITTPRQMQFGVRLAF